VAFLFFDRYRAASPLTCGAAMEVPVRDVRPPPGQVEYTPYPGALMSTHLPQLENAARLSYLVVAPTAMTQPALDGEYLHGSPLSLPAATMSNTPDLDRFITAVLTAVGFGPPSERFATAGLAALVRSHLTAATRSDRAPSPLQSRTRRARSLTPLATP